MNTKIANLSNFMATLVRFQFGAKFSSVFFWRTPTWDNELKTEATFKDPTFQDLKFNFLSLCNRTYKMSQEERCYNFAPFLKGRTERSKFLRFEDFLCEKSKKQEEFWHQRGVKKRLGPLRAAIEALETAACNNNGDVSKIPDDVFVIADELGVSPEMILEYIGKDVLFARKLNRDQTQLTPNGTIISRKVFIELDLKMMTS